jgi:outer membrane protein assembly factor BamD
MALAEIALKDDKEEEAVDALERIVNLYPENYMSEKAYFMLAKVYEDRVSGPAYDQGSTLKALNFYEDYLILYAKPPAQSIHESIKSYEARVLVSKERFNAAEEGRNQMRQTLAESKLEVAQYIEKYGKYFLVRWRELGNRPAVQFYNEAINSAPESDAARVAEKKVAELKAMDEK